MFYKISGFDRNWITEKKNEFTNYTITYYTISNKHKNLYNYVIQCYRPHIEKKTSCFRLKLVNNNYYSYSEEKTEDIIKYTFEKSDNNSKKHIDIIKDTMKNRNKIKFYISGKNIIICCSHLFFDGIKIYNISRMMISGDIIKPFSLPKYTYIPVINEIISLASLPKAIEVKNMKNSLAFDYERNLECRKIIKHKMDVNLVKRIKSELENIPFSVVFAAIQCYSMFYSSVKSFFIVGIVIAFNNPKNFNNTVYVPLKIKRPINFSNNRCIHNLKNIINQIDNNCKIYKGIISLLYSYFNIYDIETILSIFKCEVVKKIKII